MLLIKIISFPLNLVFIQIERIMGKIVDPKIEVADEKNELADHIRTLSRESSTLDPEVKNFDPYIALNGGQDGLCCYRELAPQFVEVLKKGGLVFLEIGYNQRESVSNIMEHSGLKCLHINQDLGNRDRCLVLAHQHQY